MATKKYRQTTTTDFMLEPTQNADGLPSAPTRFTDNNDQKKKEWQGKAKHMTMTPTMLKKHGNKLHRLLFKNNGELRFILINGMFWGCLAQMRPTVYHMQSHRSKKWMSTSRAHTQITLLIKKQWISYTLFRREKPKFFSRTNILYIDFESNFFWKKIFLSIFVKMFRCIFFSHMPKNSSSLKDTFDWLRQSWQVNTVNLFFFVHFQSLLPRTLQKENYAARL